MNRRVTLVNCGFREAQKLPSLPLGILYLASSLLQRGYGVDVRDYQLCRAENPTEPEELVSFCKTDASVLGFSCMNGTLPIVLMAAEKIKAARPETKIVLGGPAATSLGHKIMRKFKYIDFVLRGEGDIVFPEFLKNLYENSQPPSVPGIIFRNGEIPVEGPAPRRILNLDVLPFPAHSLLPLKEYRQTIPMVTSRGCPYRCSFCDGGALRGTRNIVRSVENCMTELIESALRTGHRKVGFLDDVFVLDRCRVFAFCDAFESLDMCLRWSVMGRADLMDEDMFRRMAETGCQAVYFGAESGSDSVLKRINKGFISAEIEQKVRAATQYFEYVTVSLIWGYPFETLPEFYESLALATECRFYGASVQFHLLSPMPGSELYEQHGHGLHFSEDAVSDLVCSKHGIEPFKGFVLEHPDICASFYHYPSPNFEKKLGITSGEVYNNA